MPAKQELTLRKWIESSKAGKFDDPNFDTQCDAGWYDWFCRDDELNKRLKKMTPKVYEIAESKKIDQDKTYVFFKNNCPVFGDTYDDFRVCDLETGDVIFTVTPKSGHTDDKGLSEVWGRENDFNEPLVHGNWHDVKKFFGV